MGFSFSDITSGISSVVHDVVSIPGGLVNDVGQAMHFSDIIGGFGEQLTKAEDGLSGIVHGIGSGAEQVIGAGTAVAQGYGGALTGFGKGAQALGEGGGQGLVGLGQGAGGLLGSIGDFLPIILLVGGGIALVFLLKQ